MEVEYKKIRDLTWEASRLNVSDREMDQLREDKETVYSILSESVTLEKYKGKLMRDIREEGRLREYRVQGFRGIYMEILAISGSCLNIRHFWALVKAVKESYFGSQVYSKAYKFKEHSMDLNHHEGKRKSRILLGSISYLILSRKRTKTEKPNGKDNRSSHRKLIEKYKGIKDRK